MLVGVASAGQCWPSPGKLAPRGIGGPTQVGASHPSAFDEADVRIVSSAATSIAMGFDQAIAISSPFIPFPFRFPRVLAPLLVLDISRHKRGLDSCKMNNEKHEKGY